MPPYRAGDYVKVEFKDDETGESEWMWVVIDYVNENTAILFGNLDSEPIVHKSKLKLGQRLAVAFSQIREHKRTEDS